MFGDSKQHAANGDPAFLTEPRRSVSARFRLAVPGSLLDPGHDAIGDASQGVSVLSDADSHALTSASTPASLARTRSTVS